jgi:hypothetical protein
MAQNSQFMLLKTVTNITNKFNSGITFLFVVVSSNQHKYAEPIKIVTQRQIDEIIQYVKIIYKEGYYKYSS